MPTLKLHWNTIIESVCVCVCLPIFFPSRSNFTRSGTPFPGLLYSVANWPKKYRPIMCRCVCSSQCSRSPSSACYCLSIAIICTTLMMITIVSISALGVMFNCIIVMIRDSSLCHSEREFAVISDNTAANFLLLGVVGPKLQCRFNGRFFDRSRLSWTVTFSSGQLVDGKQQQHHVILSNIICIK